MLSVHDDGGERGPHLPGVFEAFSPDLKAQVVEKVKSFRVDATFVTGFKKGDWIKAGKRESIIVRLFDLFGSWLVHFNKIRPTAENSVYDVLVHAHFDNFRLFAGRAFNAIAYPRMCLPPTPGIEHVLSVASAGASLGSQVVSMQQSSSDFVQRPARVRIGGTQTLPCGYVTVDGFPDALRLRAQCVRAFIKQPRRAQWSSSSSQTPTRSFARCFSQAAVPTAPCKW